MSFGAIFGGLATGAVSAFGARRQNQLAMEEAKRNRDFQMLMSNTAHQRQVRDLKKAGLNPILAAGGSGASSPAGNVAPISDSIGQGVQSAVAAARAYAEIENIKARTNLVNNQADTLKPTAEVGDAIGSAISNAKDVAKQLPGRYQTLDTKNMRQEFFGKKRDIRRDAKYQIPEMDHSLPRNKDYKRMTFNTFFKERISQGTGTPADLKKLETALKSGLLKNPAYWRNYLKRMRTPK